jgi:hypothetical protein
MPTRSPRSTRDIADRENQSDNSADMLRTADGHRPPPRYPDGRDFDICDNDMKAHVSEIRPFRGDFAAPRPEMNADGT